MQQPNELERQESPNDISTKISNNYRSLGQVKISFKILHDFVKEVNKLQLNLPAETKLIEVKRKVDELSKKNFLFYLKDSFMPSLDSRIGDLAQCYGRFDEKQGVKKYEITFAASSIKDEYG